MGLAAIFFGIAFLYAAVGFGGGSSYLAAMALWGFPVTVLRSTALLCNVLVVANSTWVYGRAGLLDLKTVVPLSLASVPMAYWGATFLLKENLYFIILGSLLLVSAALLFFQKNKSKTLETISYRPQSPYFLGFLGGSIGFLSGLVGLGGGIFLSPILHFLKTDSAQRIAANAAFFILINSLAGLLGLFQSGSLQFNFGVIMPLLVAVFIGGQLGSRFGVHFLSHDSVRKITALLIFYAGINLLSKSF
jgi:uncharacterized protein